MASEELFFVGSGFGYNMKIYIMRHGQSKYNIKNLINVDPNIEVGLTDKGREQAREAEKKLGDLDVIYVSEFLRTMETAKEINKKRNLGIKIDGRLNEFNPGMQFEGKSGYAYETAIGGNPENYDGGGETIDDCIKRLKSVFKDLKKEKYDNVLVVTHEIPVRMSKVIFEKMDKLDAYNVHYDNCDFLEFNI
jgi:phosphoserine phosphatase